MAVSMIFAVSARTASLQPLAVSACALLCLLGTLAWPHAQAAARVADRIVAVVNNELITLSELKTEIAAEEQRIHTQYRGAERQRRLQQVGYMGLTRMIERKLQMQVAKSKGVEISDAEVERAMRELQRQGEKVDESNPDDKKSIKEQLMLMRVVEREVRSGVMVSEQDMRRYYEGHQSRFSLPEEYRISQILIVTKSHETAEDAKARADSVSAALKQGGDFAELALKYSDGAESTRGGNLGFVRQGELLPPIERALATLKPGEVSDPIESTEGLHLIRLDEKKPSQFRPFAEVKAEIQSLVYQQKTEDIYQLWMADLKNKAFIEVKF
jgi:peptidyl-prolyl cis-trans isomerase SurA